MENFNLKLSLFILFINVVLFGQSKLEDSRETAITRAIEKVGPSVVSINTQQFSAHNPFSSPYFPFYNPYPDSHRRKKSSGSGVIISPDGYLLTNTHVIERASIITATLSGGKEYNVEVIGIDKTTDVALLKLDGNNFPYAEMGNSDDLIIGEWVIALGNPFELFSINNQPTATVGIISGINMDFGLQESGRILQNMIQTDASINPGNSGGPLVNSKGEVIGINTFIYTASNFSTGSIGIGFSIAINTAIGIASELKISGKINRSYSTGLRGYPLNRNTIRKYNIPFRYGVVVGGVQENSPASKAGLVINDIIVSAEGKKVSSNIDIIKIIKEKDFRPGDIIKLKIYRDQDYQNINLKLGVAR